MKRETLVLVAVIVPESMEEPVAAEMLALGATGYSAWTVRGKGIHGARPSTWNGANARVETAVSPEIAEQIVARLYEKINPAIPLKIFTSSAVMVAR